MTENNEKWLMCMRQEDVWNWPPWLGKKTAGVCEQCQSPIFFEAQNAGFRKMCSHCVNVDRGDMPMSGRATAVAWLIDLRSVAKDIHFECPACHWAVTLKPEGAALWTADGQIAPRCNRCDVTLVRTVQ